MIAVKFMAVFMAVCCPGVWLRVGMVPLIGCQVGMAVDTMDGGVAVVGGGLPKGTVPEVGDVARNEAWPLAETVLRREPSFAVDVGVNGVMAAIDGLPGNVLAIPILVLNAVSTTVLIEVTRVVRVAVGTIHSIMPVCWISSLLASANPPSINNLEQLWTPPPAHSLHQPISTLS